MTKQYIGLTKEQAQELAKQNGAKFRTISEDGQDFCVKMDAVKGRLNFTIVNNIITKVKLG